jgi:hypothetical protein
MKKPNRISIAQGDLFTPTLNIFGNLAASVTILPTAAVQSDKTQLHLCDLCPAQFEGTADQARNNGWQLTPKAEFCGNHV